MLVRISTNYATAPEDSGHVQGKLGPSPGKLIGAFVLFRGTWEPTLTPADDEYAEARAAAVEFAKSVDRRSGYAGAESEAGFERVRTAAPELTLGVERAISSGMAEELMDAKIAAAEARTDAKLAGFQGNFNVLSLKLDGIAASIKDQKTEATGNRNALMTTILTVGFALAGLLIAVVSYGDAIFSRGMSMRDLVHSTVEELAAKPAPLKTP